MGLIKNKYLGALVSELPRRGEPADTRADHQDIPRFHPPTLRGRLEGCVVVMRWMPR